MRLAPLTAVLMLAALPFAAQAQSPEPVLGKLSLDQLADRAGMIVVSTVTARRAEWEHHGASRLIVTKVTLEVEQALKGSPPRTLVVEVLGGTIGDETLRVSHVPEFRVGDRDVLFLTSTAHTVSPLVGADQGRFRIVNESATGVARMVTGGFVPLRSAADVDRSGAELPLARSLGSALSLSDFAALVRDRVRLMERRR